jgi:hypothetical protein
MRLTVVSHFGALPAEERAKLRSSKARGSSFRSGQRGKHFVVLCLVSEAFRIMHVLLFQASAGAVHPSSKLHSLIAVSSLSFFSMFFCF